MGYRILKDIILYFYRVGRTNAQIIDHTNTFEYIQSGKIFDDESTHLSDLEHKIDKHLDVIKPNISRYDVGVDYDDISRIAEMVGYSNQRYFAMCFKKFHNVTPTEYRDIHNDYN